MRPRFHLAFPVDDLERARAFYVDCLGASVGRTSDRWVDFRFFDHQITAHLCKDVPPDPTNQVDHDAVPVRHFGVILEWDQWEELAAHLSKRGQSFLLAPKVRFEGAMGEQGTFFLRDPAGNALEFKAFRHPGQVFAAVPPHDIS